MLNVKKDGINAAALQSFANAGGTAHLAEVEMVEEGLDIAHEPSAQLVWKTTPQLERWVVSEGAKASEELTQ